MYFSKTTKCKPLHCVLECSVKKSAQKSKEKCSEKFIIYNTFLDTTLCIQTKSRKQKHNTRLYDRNRKKCKNKLKKNQQSKSKFFMLFFEGIYSVCQFLYFCNLPFAFIHYTFCFNSISMGFCWIFSSFQHETL